VETTPNNFPATSGSTSFRESDRASVNEQIFIIFISEQLLCDYIDMKFEALAAPY
jgi:hypothetical protein